MKIIEMLLDWICNFLSSLLCVTVAWKFILPKLFAFIPEFGFLELCQLTIAIDFLFSPATIASQQGISKILRKIKK